jgi:hypothetical protein
MEELVVDRTRALVQLVQDHGPDVDARLIAKRLAPAILAVGYREATKPRPGFPVIPAFFEHRCTPRAADNYAATPSHSAIPCTAQTRARANDTTVATCRQPQRIGRSPGGGERQSWWDYQHHQRWRHEAAQRGAWTVPGAGQLPRGRLVTQLTTSLTWAFVCCGFASTEEVRSPAGPRNDTRAYRDTILGLT